MSRKRRNHFIPRMLLKRFATRIESNGEKHFIWRYERGIEPKELSTKDVGVAKDFYGENDDVLENSFVQLEGEHSSLLRGLDSGALDVNRESEQLADLVWLLAMRTSANRKMMQQSLVGALNEMNQQISSQAARNFMHRHMEDKFQKKLAELPRWQRRELRKPQSRQKLAALRGKYLAEIPDYFNGFIGKLGEEAPSLLKKSHNEGLQDLISSGAKSPTRRTPQAWKIITSEEPEFVLGDACVFCVDATGAIVPLIGSGELTQLYFPIDAHRVIVGQFNEQIGVLANREIVEATVKVSANHVFAQRQNDPLRKLVDQFLSAESFMLRPEDSKALVEDVWRN